MPRKRASNLTTRKQTEIGKFREKNPKYSFLELGLKYNCTAQQARYAVELYEKGLIGTSDSRLVNAHKRKVEELKKRMSVQEMLDEMIAETTASLKVSELPVDKKVALLDKLASAAQKLLNTDLLTQLKNPDAERVSEMLKIMNPKISNKEIIETWRKADEILKARKRRSK